MADFLQAVQWIKEGYKVFRTGSSVDWMMRRSGKGIVVCDFEGDTVHMEQGMFFDDLEATDWQVVDEEALAKNVLKVKEVNGE